MLQRNIERIVAGPRPAPAIHRNTRNFIGLKIVWLSNEAMARVTAP